MSWIQVSIEAPSLDPQALTAFFEAGGAQSVTLVDAADQPLFEPQPGTTPLWSATRVTALFDASVVLAPLRQAFADRFGEAALAGWRQETLDDRDWERAWLERFRPMQFGEHLWICPAGQRPPPAAGQVLIDLDPGLAFGTGTHPTTALCLEWLDRHPPAGLEVLDFGCGSGILAIAALKLGAARVHGVDIDEQALWASRENAARNQVDARLTTSLPDAADMRPVDLLLANILANPLIELAPQLAARVKPGGSLVLSGILSDQAAAVQAAYVNAFEFAPATEQDGWVRLEACRRAVDI